MIEIFRRTFCWIIAGCFIFGCFFTNPKNIYADSKVNGNFDKNEIKRSLESLRDIDYQTWQIIVYPSNKVSNNLTLRILGYPGSLRIDHPVDLTVNSGRKTWLLKDITKTNKANVEFLNDSAAEFDLTPLVAGLDKNRPLRLSLPGLINDLPIPPYLVSEWRTLAG
ncbi:DUF3122 domain-containing protein [Prochlorococcus marinus]|nr:DUF3122 domain-containing protein [Prochlorococcus marinus]